MGAILERWSRWWARPVIDGTVDCELRGPVGVDECRDCTWLLDLSDTDGQVVCRPDAARLAARGTGI